MFVALFTAACVTLPPDVTQAVASALAEMDNGVRVPPPASLASRVSVSPSGDDWVIDYGKTGDFGWCGTGGCTRDLWVARGNGHIRVFSEQVLGWRLMPGAPAHLDIDIHGANCDASGSEPCLRRFVWNELSGGLEEGINREGSGYLVGPLFQPVEPEAYPETVMLEIQRRDEICHAAGGLVDSGECPAVSSPDLNGDGTRDWIVGSKYIGCHSPTDPEIVMPRMGLTVITSTGDGWQTSLTVDETAYAIELGAHTARFGLRDEELCQNGPGCPTRFFVWNDATHALEDSGKGQMQPARNR